ncbi:MAG: chemotaxis response regulator protein-glutamate methylesterase [Marinilabiliales bacterium]|nr:MAG: chemotaxis response regulator protein-glutamate methylesterase [Marinilabiliales bacterium]
MKKIKVLVVDDSALVRQSLSSIIEQSDDMELLATAADPYFAVAKMKKHKPDVITLDIQMPKMDGLTFLKKIMAQHPVPVVIISSIAKKDSDIALEAYRLGASEVIEKPKITDKKSLEDWQIKFKESILTASKTRVSKIRSLAKLPYEKKEISKPALTQPNQISNKLILMGSSAGGTEVINTILSNLPISTAPIAIVQHMPEVFTKSYAERLNRNSGLIVKEAVSDELLSDGKAFIAPGNLHLTLKKKGTKVYTELDDGDKVNRHKPSVDALFDSACTINDKKIMAIILSGMGNDGSQAMMRLKKKGAITIAQSEDSCIIYGMPKEAYNSGAATFSLSINEIIQKIIEFSGK